MWKKLVVVCFKALSHYFLEDREKYRSYAIEKASLNNTRINYSPAWIVKRRMRLQDIHEMKAEREWDASRVV
jgi:hypothetical protein